MSNLKGGAFVITETDPKDVFVPEEFTEEQRMIHDMVQEFCIKEVQEPMLKRGKEWSAMEDKDEIVRQLEAAGELGLCGVSIEERFGGMELDFNTGLIFSAAVAQGFSFATTIGAQTSIGSLPIVYYGNEEQQAKYLPGIATGKLKAAYCLTEPGAGSDANSGKTKATLNSEGTHYILEGQKMWITNGGFADIFIVFAKIDDDKNLSAFIVEKNFGDIEIGAEEKKLGIKGSSTVQVFFNGTKVPKENLLSERGAGFKIALNILNTGRIKLAAGGIGGSKFAITKAVEYAAQRYQFEQPIADFGAMQHKIGKMASMTFACDSAVFRTGRNIDLKYEELKNSGMSRGEAKLNAVREFAIECSILKVKGSEILDYVIDEALQIHGGMGYSVETGVEMGYRDARITRIYEGTNEINRMLTVAELTKRAIQTKEVDLVGAGKKVPGYILSQYLPFKAKSSWAEEQRLVKNMKVLFMLLSGTAGKKLGKKMIDEQEMVMNLSDILAEAYVAESAMLRVQKLEQKGDIDGTKLEIMRKMVKANLYDALDICRISAESFIQSFATGTQEGMLRRFSKVLLPTYVVNPKELRRDVSRYIVEKGGYPF